MEDDRPTSHGAKAQTVLPQDWMDKEAYESLVWVAKAIADLRSMTGMSQVDLGRELGWESRGLISRIEKARSAPRFDTLCRIANALGVNVFDIFRYAEFLRDNQKERVKLALEHAALFQAETA